MKNALSILQGTKLFSGMAPAKIEELLRCLNAHPIKYGAGETIVVEGSEVREVGIVLSGHARSLRSDAAGNQLIITLLETGSFIGVLLAASRDRRSPVSVQAQEPVTVLFFSAERLMTPCEKNCAKHGLLLRNYFDSISEKSLVLHDRIDCLIRHTVREKVLAYLQRAAEEAHSGSFTIPLDRSAMASYLNVERSALSRELSRMKRDGLIDYSKNRFHLLSTEGSQRAGD